MKKESSSNSCRESNRWPLGISLVAGFSAALLFSSPLGTFLNSDSRTSEPRTDSVKNTTPSYRSNLFDAGDIVVLGRDRFSANTDVIFTLRLDGDRILATQIPRDSYIVTEESKGIKINSLMAYGGPEAVKSRLSQLLNRSINKYILVELDAVQVLTNMVGGLQVDVSKRLYYVDSRQGLIIDLQPGVQLLKGDDLEGFLRWRNDEEGDLGRLKRQKLVLQALVDHLKQPQNFVRLPVLFSTAFDLFETDLGPLELWDLVSTIRTANIETITLESTPFSLDGISYLETEWPNNAFTIEKNHESSDHKYRPQASPSGHSSLKVLPLSD